MNIQRKIKALLTPAELKTAWVMLVLMILGMILETLSIGLVIPSLSLLMQDDFFSRHPTITIWMSSVAPLTQPQLIMVAMISLTILYIVKNAFLAFLGWRQARFSADILVNLSQRLFTLYLQQPYSFHLQNNSAQLIRNVASEVSMFSGVITGTLVIISESLVLFGIALLLLSIEPLGAATVVLITGLTAYLYNKTTKGHITRWGERRQHYDGLRIQLLQEGLGGAKDVKLLGREADFLHKYRLQTLSSARLGELQTTFQQFPRLILELITIFGLSVLVISMLFQGREISRIVPILGLFAAAAFRLMPSVNRILNSLQLLSYSKPAVNLLFQEFNTGKPEVLSKNQAPMPLNSEISLENITYHYPDTALPALDKISLKISKGQSVGFIGASGSGKSTLVDIILGLLEPASGCIFVDKKNIYESLRKWQNQIGYVPQSIFLTDNTIRRNIAFGLPDEEIDDYAIDKAIKAAQLDDFIASLPGKVETIIGERGVKLSGGQRQRIGIARALYHDPSILVLDEATSALDTATEEKVMHAVSALRGDKTLIIIAHRLSTLLNCDHIYVIEKGRLVLDGSVDEVINRYPSRISGVK